MSVFRVDILNAAGDIQGDGPLTSVTSMPTTESLDKVGEATFSFPASDERGALITNGSRFDLWAPKNGQTTYLGRYIHSRETIDPDGMIRTIRCHSIMRELGWQPALMRRYYTNQPVEDVVDGLVTLTDGWTTQVDAGIGNTTLTIEGGSVHAAVDILRDRWGQHFRIYSPTPDIKRLDFGVFGADSGIRIIRAKGQVMGDMAVHKNIAIIPEGGLRVEEDSDEIWNSLIVLGAGNGTAQLTMETATLGAYTLQSGLNPDGSSYWYIQDAASVATYGARWQTLAFTGIRPVSNTDADIENAANALKLSAEAYMARHVAKNRTLSVSVVGLRQDLRVGDTVKLTYRGVALKRDGSDYVYLDEDDDFYVMDIATNRAVSENGYEETVNLTVSTVADRRTSDTDIMVNVIKDMEALKLHPVPGPARPTIGPYTRDIDSTHSAKFTVSIGPETLTLNYAKLKFRTRPFRTLASGASGGGSHNHRMFQFEAAQLAVNCDQRYSCRKSGGGDMTLVFGKGTHASGDLYTRDTESNHTHVLSYGINDDASYPRTIGVKINGIDRTIALGGTWAPSNAPVDVSVDITQYLVDAVGGLRQDHDIEFTCTSGQGTIEFEVPMLCVVQPIAVT